MGDLAPRESGLVPQSPLFATTHWSVVLGAGDASSPEAEAALSRLCQTYWLPVYAFVRKRGHSPEEAQDLTQAFFANFLEKQHVTRANRERGRLISDARNAAQVTTDHDTVIVGAGKIHGTSGGTETASVMRFMDEVKVIHVGETVEWTTSEAVTNHTITFGPEPDALHQIPPSSNVTVDADGARHAYINSPSDAVHSGFITQAPLQVRVTRRPRNGRKSHRTSVTQER